MIRFQHTPPTKHLLDDIPHIVDRKGTVGLLCGSPETVVFGFEETVCVGVETGTEFGDGREGRGDGVLGEGEED
jgi:hypothetical protein